MFKKLNEKLERYVLKEEDLKPFKFTFDFGNDRKQSYIEYGTDEEDAKANLFKNTRYLQGEEENIISVEPVKEDHEYVTEDFMMIHKSGDGPDASGTVTFIPAPFGYEYDCSVKDFNGRGPQWSTIRTIEGIRIWFRNVLFEFGAKEVTIGKYHWDIDDFSKDDDMDEDYDDFENDDFENDDFENDDFGEEDWDEILDDFLSSLPTKLEAVLGEGYECHQTDNTIYVNSKEHPDNTVFISPIEDSSQMINIGLLDDTNEEIECYEIEIEPSDEDWAMKNIVDNIKELFEL